MGLKDLIPDDDDSSHYKRYSSHKWDEKLQGWAEDYQKRFPERVEYDFIEVSPQMTKTHGYAYWKSDGAKYIRISEMLIDEYPEWYVGLVLLHEMVHIYFYQNDMQEIGDSDRIFNWVLGRVGADINGIGPDHPQFDIIIEFLNNEW